MKPKKQGGFKNSLKSQRKGDLEFTNELKVGYSNGTIFWKPRTSQSGKEYKYSSNFIFSSISKAQEKSYAILSSTKLLSENDPDLLLREYFIAKPSYRPKLRHFTAKHINSVEAVLEVLNWSRKKGIQDAYDSAIALLAERGEILLKVAKSMQCSGEVSSPEALTSNNAIEGSTKQNDISAFEEKWEVLIKSIACARHISPEQKFNTIRNLIPNQTRRLVKAAIIDALLIMQDEIDADSIRRELGYFLSSKELDKYIQDYAKEAMEEI